MRHDVTQLSISIADRLVRDTSFLSMSEAAVLKQPVRSNCPGCSQNRQRQRARQAIPRIMENMVKGGKAKQLYSILKGIYGSNSVYFRLPGTSKIVFNGEGMRNVRSSH